MELALAIVKEFNPWLAVAIGLVAGSVSLGVVNWVWAKQAQYRQDMEHTEKMFQNETDRKLKTEVYPLHPDAKGGKVIENRRREEY